MATATVQYSRARSTYAALRLSVLQFLADPQWLVPSMIAPVVFALVSFELFRGAGPYFLTYAILGAGMMSMWGQTLYGSGWATGMDREFGTLEPTIQAPTPYLYVVVGRVLWNVISGLIGGGIVYVVIVIVAGGPPAVPNPVSLAFPPTWGLDALRYLSIPGYQGFGWGFWGDLAGAVATTVVYLSVAGLVFQRVERH